MNHDTRLIVSSANVDLQPEFEYGFSPPILKPPFRIMNARSLRPTRNAPLKRSQIEETLSIKPPAKRTYRKSAPKPVESPQNKRKSNTSHSKATKKPTVSRKELLKLGSTRVLLFILI